ncbi:Brp/Blh family beta-carotene 15,15'-dioxygenase [Erythrobacter sp. QSSC1-22B]|uniref:Brp/Blh family beta-carotene 15,15'-dioxygenase n=1 Tax=Erythrobacter sp. QSSC1-22B TaxID=1860125 RepID=UPI00082F47AF|nr:Brp/Blh family beta-carotene 15,15'-dioxygenase [Erythrobacter sp. QSSC1-22B]
MGAGLVFFLLGLAHGAGDENEGAIARITPIHAGAYILTGAAVAGLFLFAPFAGLALFLTLSAWHFARSDCAFSPITRYAIAGLAVGGSALFRPETTADVFAVITGTDVPINVVRVLALLGLTGVGCALYALMRGLRGFGHAVIALASVALFHPVLAVGLVFLIAHAVPVQQRQMVNYGRRAVWQAVALPSAVAAAGAITMALLVATGQLGMSFAIALGFGMATPHMLTERLER